MEPPEQCVGICLTQPRGCCGGMGSSSLLTVTAPAPQETLGILQAVGAQLMLVTLMSTLRLMVSHHCTHTSNS